MANWIVSVDRERTDQSQWVHTNIDIYEARELALLVGNIPGSGVSSGGVSVLM